MKAVSVTAALCVLALTVTSQATDQATQCEEGWTYYDYNCYMVRDEYESFEHADATCNLMGAELAYGKRRPDFAFLTRLVKKSNHFSYWYGAKENLYAYPTFAMFRDYNGYYTLTSMQKFGYEVKLPPVTTYSAPSDSTCVGLRENEAGDGVFTTGLSCSLVLPYICRGDPSVLPKQPDSHYTNFTQGDEDVYWVSDVTDRKSHQDAVKACQAKSMTLASMRDTDQRDIIHNSIRNRTYSFRVWMQRINLDPWWIGLQVSNSHLSWSDGVAVKDDVINWSRFPQPNNFYWSDKRYFLFDGTFSIADYYSTSPFICMRPHFLTRQYGCPVSWSRAGQSCYKMASLLFTTQTKAQSMCGKLEAHLVSFDTELERGWARSSTLASDFPVWVSLTDKRKRGEYVWADGSKPNPGVVVWSQNMAGGSGDCGVFYSYSKSVYFEQCDGIAFPGCQYKPTSGQCATNDWFYFNGYCYYSPENMRYDKRTTYGTMLHFCYRDVEASDPSVTMEPLKLDSQTVMEKMQSRAYSMIWLGLTRKNGDIFWADGSTLDYSIFGHYKQPYPGTQKEPFHCANVDPSGYYKTSSCDSTSAVTMCEKKAPWPTGGATSCHASGAQLLMTCCAVFVWYVTSFLGL